MPTTTTTWQIARFVTGIYSERAKLAYWAGMRGDLLSKLLVPGRPVDPYPIYEQMRALGPLLPTRLGNWSTTSHRLCREVLQNRAFGVAPDDPEVAQPQSSLLDLSLLQLNPPDHTRLRRLAAPAFSPRAMAAYEPLVADAIHRLLDAAMASPDLEVMSAFAGPLPIAVMTRLLGLPDEPERLRVLGSTIARALDGIWSLRQARTLAGAERDLRLMFEDLLDPARRTAEPADLVARLLADQGEQITAEELVPLVRLLLIAGFETTVNALGNGLYRLLDDREQWQLLVDEPDRAAAVAEEVLRFEPPVQQTARVALSDQVLTGPAAGRHVRAGQWVVLLIGAANRDPEVFDRPDSFDITRARNSDHLAFSGGAHYCLGSPLARMELTEAFRALAQRFPRMRLTGPVTMRPGSVLRGPHQLRVHLG